jgi:hypothetical protein
VTQFRSGSWCSPNGSLRANGWYSCCVRRSAIAIARWPSWSSLRSRTAGSCTIGRGNGWPMPSFRRQAAASPSTGRWSSGFSMPRVVAISPGWSGCLPRMSRQSLTAEYAQRGPAAGARRGEGRTVPGDGHRPVCRRSHGVDSRGERDTRGAGLVRVDAARCVVPEIASGRVTGIRIFANPDKLQFVSERAARLSQSGEPSGS